MGNAAQEVKKIQNRLIAFGACKGGQCVVVPREGHMI